MPAIQPALLRQQAALLAEHFDEPVALVRSLHHLLDFYADRTHRSGQGTPPPLITAYRVQLPVLRQILAEFAVRTEADPQSGLTLCQELWKQPYLEFRWLAANLLGTLPVEQGQEILDLFFAWVSSRPEPRLMDSLLTASLRRLRQEDPERLIKLVDGWLFSRDSYFQGVALQILLTLINEPTYENLPVFYRLIKPHLGPIPSAIRPYVLDLIEALARRSPTETAFFLQRSLEPPSHPDVGWLIRQSLGAFPNDLQERLRAAVRNA